MPDPNPEQAPAKPPIPNPAPTVDVQAQINQALSAQQAEFSKKLKEATGHGDINALNEANLKAQGKLQELADSKAQEAAAYKSRFEQSHINNALLAAANAAVDPATVGQLLAGKAICDEQGNVTVDGKPVAEAVKQLLADKPFLAKAQGGTGSGAAQTAAVNAQPAQQDTLNPLERLQAARRTGAQ